jgi:hypothetical protein
VVNGLSEFQGCADVDHGTNPPPIWAAGGTSTYTPLTLTPGQTGTITLTFTPNAPKGTVVRGFVGVDTFNSFTVVGDELVNIPYTYTVG